MMQTRAFQQNPPEAATSRALLTYVTRLAFSTPELLLDLTPFL